MTAKNALVAGQMKVYKLARPITISPMYIGGEYNKGFDSLVANIGEIVRVVKEYEEKSYIVIFLDNKFASGRTDGGWVLTLFNNNKKINFNNTFKFKWCSDCENCQQRYSCFTS